MTATMEPTLDMTLAATRFTPVDACKEVSIAGRRVSVTPVFDTFWRFAAARQEIYNARQAGHPGPWTDDQILREHRFTNCYRAADRVSQYLIREVAYGGPQNNESVVSRILLFKLFNKISTWQLIHDEFGQFAWGAVKLDDIDAVLSEAFMQGQRLYSAAYVIPPPRLGGERKHSNHLRLLQQMMEDGICERLTTASSMRAAFEVLRSYPAMGPFLAYQFLIDINYSAVLDFQESEFVVPGPGARDGIRKCFGSAADGIEAEVIRYMSDTQDEHFGRLGLNFDGLRGRKLQLIDCQNLFCEVDKYARVAHPDIAGLSGRVRIKQKFRQDCENLTSWFPPKWNLNPNVDAG